MINNDFINHFQAAWVLFLLPVPLLLLGWNYWRRHHRPAVIYSDLSIAAGLPRTLRQRVDGMLPFTRALALCFGIVALARPQFGTVDFNTNTVGIDIAMVIDVSGSMQERDYQPNRLEVAKQSAINFAEKRRSDRLTVVLFGAEASVLVPPTLDVNAVKMFLEAVHDGIIANQATAIGDGLGLALLKLQESDTKSKVIVLLTDGDNNAGKLQPMQSAEAAAALGVRIHVIGVGRGQRGGGVGVGAMFGGGQGIGFDEGPMKAIAEATGGQYFRVTDADTLERVYTEIDQLERTKIEVEETADYNERFMYFWFPGLALLALEFLLRALWLRRLP